MKSLEDKIGNIAKGKLSQDASNENRFKLSEMVGVFVPHWHKWIRATIKKVDGEGNLERFCVWATDYGFPLVSRASHIINLPNSFKGIGLKNEKNKIFMGGIKNIWPAQISFDVAQVTNVHERLPNWSLEAIQLTQNLLSHTIKLVFEDVNECKQKKSHFFGRLMMQRRDGNMMDMVKCLLEMNMAVLAQGEFMEEVTAGELLKQRHWLSANGEMLDSKTVISPFVIAKDESGCTDKTFFDDEPPIGDEEIVLDEGDEQFFNESVSVIEPIRASQMIKAAELLTISKGQEPTSNDLPPKNECTEEQNGNAMLNDSNNQNGQQVKGTKRNRRYNRTKTDYRRDQNRSDNQNDPKPQQSQNQRAAVTNHQNSQPILQSHFNRLPLNSFNMHKNTFNPPMHYDQPQGQFNQPQFRRGASGGGYVPPNFRQSFQNRRNRNDPTHNRFGDPDFTASFARPPLGIITEHVAVPNAPTLMKIPYHHQPFFPPGHIQAPNYGQFQHFNNNQARQLNGRQNNRQNIRYAPKNVGHTDKYRNNFKKPTEAFDAKLDAQSKSTEKTNSMVNERKTQQMTIIKSEAAQDETNSNVEAELNTPTEKVEVKIEP